MWYLIVSIPDLWRFTYFVYLYEKTICDIIASKDDNGLYQSMHMHYRHACLFILSFHEMYQRI